MSSIKKLAGQTLWYGVSSIFARFVGYLLTPILTYSKHVSTADFGKMGLVYAAIPVLNTLFTYGFETAYFRFASREENKKSIYSTAFFSLLSTTIIFTIILWYCQSSLCAVTGLTDSPKIIQLSIFVIALDALNTIPFARLRQQGRPRKYAFIRVSSILINLVFVWFFTSFCPEAIDTGKHPWVTLFYNPATNPIVYVVAANLIQCIVTLLLLVGEIKQVHFQFNTRLWKEMMVYSMPLIIVGLGGVVNETFDRIMLHAWLPGSLEYKDEQVGIYNACYKLAILISLFIQAFKMGAEPFFFKQAEEDKSPQRTYARVMKFFVLTITFMFLVVVLYLPIWQTFIGPKYRVGLAVVPILLLANMFLGIYYNLAIWYKLSNKTIAGTYITLIGTGITVVINYFFVPHFSYMAGAWGTFSCYLAMMVLSFVWGQKEYPIPYAWKKLLAYIVIVVIIFFIHKGITYLLPNVYLGLLLGSALIFVYGWFILLVEKKEFQKLPYVGRYIK